LRQHKCSQANKNVRCNVCKKDFRTEAEATVHYATEIHHMYAFSFAHQGQLSSSLFPQTLEPNEVSKNEKIY
jgi:hypothetical protein